MCGILGIWHTGGGSISESVVFNATNLLAHRGPDDEGYWFYNNITGSFYEKTGNKFFLCTQFGRSIGIRMI